VLTPGLTDGTAVAGLVVLGWEDAKAFVQAAELAGRPLILQAGPGCRAHTPLSVLGAMFRTLGEGATIPVVAHLDHGEDYGVCRQAIDCGFTSVMFDGSALPLNENIDRTAAIVELAHGSGVSVEAELGFVGYSLGKASRGTEAEEVARFVPATGIDALAIAAGNTHLMTKPGAEIDRVLLTEIAVAAPGLPLVLHGGSGIAAHQRRRLAAETPICKFNIGTELRKVFGQALRQVLAEDLDAFDRIRILGATEPALVAASRRAIESLSAG
jgi:fructose-bisphosphate aldolase class II